MDLGTRIIEQIKRTQTNKGHTYCVQENPSFNCKEPTTQTDELNEHLAEQLRQPRYRARRHRATPSQVPFLHHLHHVPVLHLHRRRLLLPLRRESNLHAHNLSLIVMIDGPELEESSCLARHLGFSVGRREVDGEDGALLEVLALEELRHLLQRRLLLVLVLVGGGQSAPHGALHLHSVLGPLDLLDHHDPQELLRRGCDDGVEEEVVPGELASLLAFPPGQVLDDLLFVQVDADRGELDLEELQLDVSDPCATNS